jgi:hypothetical protein
MQTSGVGLAWCLCGALYNHHVSGDISTESVFGRAGRNSLQTYYEPPAPKAVGCAKELQNSLSLAGFVQVPGNPEFHQCPCGWPDALPQP